MSRKRVVDFTLTVDGVKELTPEVENAIWDAGCDDATICMRRGKLNLQFSRVAYTESEAIGLATRQVCLALPELKDICCRWHGSKPR